MRIGILTFHSAKNYGAVLQAFALQHFLKENNLNVEIIDYRQNQIEANYKLFSYKVYQGHSLKQKIKIFISRALTIYSRYQNKNNFSSFLSRKCLLSNNCFREEELVPKDYDVYIFGSDQIWNPRILGYMDPVFLGDFSTNDAKKIAYAASMGNEIRINKEIREKLKKSLENFTAIGVREKSLSLLLDNILGIKSQIVLDPTLLAGREIFDKVAKKPKITDRYVLLYLLEKDLKAVTFAKKIAKEMGAKVLMISANGYFWNNFSKEHIISASPEEFLGWFKYAAYIVTISFHGTAFSVLFEKDFYTLKSALQGRSENLLKSIGLSGRLVSSSETISPEKIDYTEVNRKLTELRLESSKFLLESIRQ